MCLLGATKAQGVGEKNSLFATFKLPPQPQSSKERCEQTWTSVSNALF
jgi:hypothetical protein